ncbi:hypothetical protein [Oceanobacillus sp. CAU 1775]
MDDKHLDELLGELKDNYNRLPEYADTNNIMSELPTKKQKKRRLHIIPLVAIIAGFFLFFVLALPQMDENQQADETAAEATVEESGDEDAKDEADDEMLEYADMKKEEFRKALGVDSVENFAQVEHVEHLIRERGMYHFDDEELIAMIDEIYIIPEQMIEALDQMEGEERIQQWELVIQSYMYLGMSLTQYVETTIRELSLNVQEQRDLVENQFDYTGPIELVELLQLIHGNGYFLERMADMADYIEVSTDYSYLVEEVEHKEEDEGILRFLTFISEDMDLRHYGYPSPTMETPWYEYDDIILEMEDIYKSYPEYRGLFSHYTGALHATSEYLTIYLQGGFRAPVDEVREQLIEELRHFTENHQDSTFWPIVSKELEKYESGDYRSNMEDYYNTQFYNAYFLFNNIDSKLSYDSLHEVYSWPMDHTTEMDYRNYENFENPKVLVDMSPLELLSMYTFAEERDQDLYELLYIGEGEQERMDWPSIISQSETLLENVIEENTIEFSFVNSHIEQFTNTIIATVTLHNDGEGWNVISQEKMDINNNSLNIN